MEEEFQRCKTRIFPQQHRREQEDSAASSVTVVGGHSLWSMNWQPMPKIFITKLQREKFKFCYTCFLLNYVLQQPFGSFLYDYSKWAVNLLAAPGCFCQHMWNRSKTVIQVTVNTCLKPNLDTAYCPIYVYSMVSYFMTPRNSYAL